MSAEEEMQFRAETVDLYGQTGIRVHAVLEGHGEFTEVGFLKQNGKEIDIENFASGRIKPSGVVVLHRAKDGTKTLWELSEWASELYRILNREENSQR